VLGRLTAPCSAGCALMRPSAQRQPHPGGRGYSPPSAGRLCQGACWWEAVDRMTLAVAEGSPVPYTPPAGWIEQLSASEARAQAQRFHLRPNCPAIVKGAVLGTSDKPYSAARCPVCAK